MKTAYEIHDMIQTGRKDIDYVLNIIEHLNNRLAVVESKFDKALLVERVYQLISATGRGIAMHGKLLSGQALIDSLTKMSAPDLLSMWHDLELVRPENRMLFNEAINKSRQEKGYYFEQCFKARDVIDALNKPGGEEALSRIGWDVKDLRRAAEASLKRAGEEKPIGKVVCRENP